DDILRDYGLAVAPVDDAVQMDVFGRFAGGDALDKLGEIEIALSRAHQVNEWKTPVHLDPHFTFAIAAAEGDQDIGVLFLDAAGQGERGQVLLEGAGESNDSVAGPIP